MGTAPRCCHHTADCQHRDGCAGVRVAGVRLLTAITVLWACRALVRLSGAGATGTSAVAGCLQQTRKRAVALVGETS